LYLRFQNLHFYDKTFAAPDLECCALVLRIPVVVNVESFFFFPRFWFRLPLLSSWYSVLFDRKTNCPNDGQQKRGVKRWINCDANYRLVFKPSGWKR